MSKEISLVVVEGSLEVPAVRKILGTLKLPVEDIRIINKGGCSKFWQDAPKYNQAAASVGPILGITDLDQHPCPSGLIKKYLKRGKHPQFILRIAKRELESWLLADSESLAKFFDISADLFPPNPDNESDPKRTLVNLARRSTRTSLREDIVPDRYSKATVGKGYTPRISEFIELKWHPLKAQNKSESLRRAIAAIRKATTTF
ncbi:MAG: hypothetical protein ACRD82_00585 [Blastocatellia bacterium]